jgi:uncharacterized membrane protein
MIQLLEQYWKKFKLLQALKLTLLASTFVFWTITLPAFWFYCAFSYHWPFWLLLTLLLGTWLIVIFVIYIFYIISRIICESKKDQLMNHLSNKNTILAILISILR